MSIPSQQALKAVSLALLLCFGPLAQAADAVTQAMQSANGPYRMVLFKTNGTSQAESQQALTQAMQAWDKFSSEFAAKPAAPYDRDPAFASSVAAVLKVYAKAQGEISANDLKAAHSTLEEAREIMSAMRKRNNVVVYSDHMNAYHAVMEHILVDGSALLAQPKGLLVMTAQAGALSYVAKRLSTQAPESLAKDAEFLALVDAVKQSVDRLESALQNQDQAAVKDAIGKLKGPYSKLFAKFG